MSNRGNLLLSVILLALGLVFLWLGRSFDLLHGVVMLCGVAFVLPAIVSMLSMFFMRADGRRNTLGRIIQMICSVGGFGLGVCILLMPDVFRPLLLYLFSGLLVIGGVCQVAHMSRGTRVVNYPGWLLVAPVAVLVVGIVMACFDIFRNSDNEHLVVLITGIALLAAGINGAAISVVYYRLIREMKRVNISPAVSESESGNDKAGEAVGFTEIDK